MRMMSRFLAIALLTVGVTASALGQEMKAPDPVQFRTVDEVKLRGQWYDGGSGKKSPTVILIHAFKKDSSAPGWDNLAKFLQKELKASVLSFDLRGHGKSTEVFDAKVFLSAPWNVMATKERNPDKLTTIDYKNFSNNYWRYLIEDVAAARRYVDARSDAGDCNSSRTFLIGAEEGAALGYLWTVNEWSRQAVNPSGGMLGVPPQVQIGGFDIAGCVWLSPRASLIGSGIPAPPKQWPIQANFNFESRILDVAERLRDKTQMYFVYAKGDAASERSIAAFKQLLRIPLKGNTNSKYTSEIPNAEKLVGADMLGKAINLEGSIKLFIEGMEKKAEGGEWMTRNPVSAAPRPVNMRAMGFAN